MRSFVVVLFLVLTVRYFVTSSDSSGKGSELKENIRLNARIVAFNISKTQVKSSVSSLQELDAKEFPNYGNSTIKQTYKPLINLSNTAEVQRASETSHFQSSYVDAIWTFENETDNTARGQIMIFITDAFNFTKDPQETFRTFYQTSNDYPVEESKDFVVQQCQICNAVTNVQQIKDSLFDYIAVVEIQGSSRETERLGADEIINHLQDNFANVSKIDDFSINATFTGSLKTTYYLEPTIEVNCHAMSNCDSNDITTSEATISSTTTSTLPTLPATTLATYITGDNSDIYKNNRVEFQDPDASLVLLNVPINDECRNISYWPGMDRTNIQSNICIYHFSSPNCKGESQMVNLSLSIKVDGRGLVHHESIRPCKVNEVFSTKSHRLTFTIVEFTVGESTSNPSSSREILSVGKPKEYSNKESIKMSQEFTASKVITERAEMAEDMKNSQIVKMHIGKDAKIKFGATNATEIIHKLINETYPFERLFNDSLYKKVNSKRNHTVELLRDINVSSCMGKKASGILQFRKNALFQYTARAHVWGYNYIDNLLNASDIRETLGDTYTISPENVDDGTVEVQFTGSLVTSFVETSEIIETEEEKIENCRYDCNKVAGLYQLSGGICGECHVQCKSCKQGPSVEECDECKHVRNDGICTEACPKEKQNKHGICIQDKTIPGNTTEPISVKPTESKTGIFVGVGLALAVIIAGAVIAVYMKRRPKKSVIRGHQLKEIAPALTESDRLLQNTGSMPNVEERNITESTLVETIPTTEPLKKESLSDQLTAQLEIIKMDVMKLEAEVQNFEGPHFTKVYRTLQGDCSKMQMDLDKLQVEGREAIRSERRKLYVKIDKLADELAEKAHSDGRICELCEVKE